MASLNLTSKRVGAMAGPQLPFFPILEEYLQPGTKMLSSEAQQNILKHLPKNIVASDEAGAFFQTVLALAKQIPYSHPAGPKLAKLLPQIVGSTDYISKGQKFENGELMDQWQYRWSRWGREVLDDVSYYGDINGYTNMHAFIARVEADHAKADHRRDPNLAIWELRSAMEDEPTLIAEDQREAHLMAAAQWVLIYGDVLFGVLRNGPHDHGGSWDSGPCYQPPTEGQQEESILNLHRWQFWRDGFSKKAASEETHPKLSEECKGLCVDAAKRMLDLEQNAA